MPVVNAVGYIRVSDAYQTEGTSLGTQARLIREYSERNSYNLIQIFEEPGESAKTDNRPSLLAMLEYCRQNRSKVDVVVVYKVDRFARYVFDHLNLKHRLSQCGVHLESVTESLQDTPSGRFTETLLAASAQFDNEVRAERARNATIEAVRSGRWRFTPPPGYRRVFVERMASAEPDPEAAPFVIEAFERIARKESVREVRSWLNSKGLTVSRSRLYSLLSNRLYMGQIKACGLEVAANPPCFPLVSKELFYSAQSALRPVQTPSSYERNNPDFPLRGTLRCACGQYMTACWSKGRQDRYPYYRCLFCPRMNLSRATVEDRFASHLTEIFDDVFNIPDAMQLLTDELIELDERKRRSLQTEASKLKKEVAEHEQLSQAIVLKNAQGVIPDRLAKQQLEDIEAQTALKKAKLTQAFQEPEHSMREVASYVLSFLANLAEFWQSSSDECRRKLQRFAYPDGILHDLKTGFRTANSGVLTDLANDLRLLLSRQARSKTKSPNQTSQQMREIYDLFQIESSSVESCSTSGRKQRG